MWFSSVYLKSLRGYRVPILGWGLGFGLLIAVVLAAIPSVLATPEAKAAVVALGPSFAWFAEPVQIDTPGGYATWKYGLTVLLVVIWPMLAMSSMFRGDEERGITDVLLSLPRTRTRVALERVAAMWTALILMGVIVGLFAYVGDLKVNAGFGFGGAIMYGLNLAVAGAVWGGLAAFIAQFVQERRTAAGATAGVLLVAIVLDMVHRVVSGTDWISQLSPVYYFNLSKPLIPSRGTSAEGFIVQIALAVVLTGAATWLFARRDIAGTVAVPGLGRATRPSGPTPHGLPEKDWSLGSVYARSIGMIAPATGWWTLAIAGFAGWMTVVSKEVTNQLIALVQGSPLLKEFLKVSGSGAFQITSILSGLFVFMPLLLMAYAVTQVNRWAADEEDGRLELVLATPQPRLLVILARFAALSTATIFISLMTLLVTGVTASADGISLNTGNLVAATLSMVPLGLLVAALGYLFAGWLKTAFDTGLLSFILVIWFVVDFIGPGLNWPSATLRLSALYYYGSPLVEGIQITSVLGVLAVAAAALAISSYRFTRKDIGV